LLWIEFRLALITAQSAVRNHETSIFCKRSRVLENGIAYHARGLQSSFAIASIDQATATSMVATIAATQPKAIVEPVFDRNKPSIRCRTPTASDQLDPTSAADSARIFIGSVIVITAY
jgi:hypothetical protein